MKNFLLSAFLCLFSTVFYAQKDITIYLDSIGEETEYINRTTSLVIKDFYEEKNQYNIYEYFKSGKLKSEGVCSNRLTRAKEGIFNSYYETGSLQSRIMYDKGLPYGDFILWHENGNKNTEGEYLIFEDMNGLKVSKSIIKNYWDENSVQKIFNGNGTYTETSKTESVSGEIRNGYKEGLWECTSTKTKDQRIYSETYKRGKLISGTSFNNKNLQFDYTELHTDASPKKGFDHFNTFVTDKIDSSSLEKRHRQIKLHATFIIDEDGKICAVKIIRGSIPKINVSFEKALLKYPNWNPALQRGKPVKAKFSLPVSIEAN